MASSRAPAGATAKVSHQSLLLGIVALTVVYQVAFHIAAQGRLEVPGVACPGGESVESDGQCTEIQLFAHWREAEALLDEAAGTESPDELAAEIDEAEALLDEAEGAPAPSSGPRASIVQASAPAITPARESPQAEVQAPHGLHRERFEDLASPKNASAARGPIVTSVVATHTSAWGKQTDNLQEHLEAQMLGLMSAHQRLAAPAQENRPLLEQIMALGREMCQDARRRERPTCSQFVEAATTPETRKLNSSNVTQEQQLLVSSATDQNAADIESSRRNGMREKRKADLAERLANSENAQSRSNSTRGQQALVKNTTSIRASGIDNAEIIAKLEAHRARLTGSMKAWELELVRRIMDVGHDLCAETSRKGYSSCAPFLANETEANHTKASDLGVAAPAASTEEHKPISYDARRKLFWPPTGLDSPQLRGSPAGSANVSTEELRGAKWNARIPKVACIMAVPATARARAELRYAVDNFFLQSYEGPRQLVLVHHAEDERGSKLARKYADGSYIKAVAARGPAVPSTPALRYGAWSSDADIVAHWDMATWHHPERLAMQVRALGLTRRPACMLRRVTLADAHGGRGPTPESAGAGDSLVGEKGWMAKHWYPGWSGTGEQDAAIEAGGARSWQHRLALLDAPKLLVRHEEDPSAVAPLDL